MALDFLAKAAMGGRLTGSTGDRGASCSPQAGGREDRVPVSCCRKFRNYEGNDPHSYTENTKRLNQLFLFFSLFVVLRSTVLRHHSWQGWGKGNSMEYWRWNLGVTSCKALMATAGVCA